MLSLRNENCTFGSSRCDKRERERENERCLPVQWHVVVWQHMLHTGGGQSAHQGSVWKHLLIPIVHTSQMPQGVDSERGRGAVKEREGVRGREGHTSSDVP